MPEAKDENSKPFDAFQSFRGIRDAYLDALSKTMIEAVNTEAYAQTTGAMLDYVLTASAPFREALDKSTLQALQQMSLPSRQEIAALAERFTNLELRIDDIDAKMDRLLKELARLNEPRDAGRESAPGRRSAKRS